MNDAIGTRTRIIPLNHGSVVEIVLDRRFVFLADATGAPMSRLDATMRRVHRLYGWSCVSHDGSAEGERIAINTLIARCRDAGMARLARKLDAALPG